MDLSIFFAGTGGSVPTARRGPAGDPRPPRCGPDPVRLRRGHPAPAGRLGRAGRSDRRLPHPFPRRPLAGPARHAQDLRPARPRPAADGVRAAGARALMGAALRMAGRVGFELDVVELAPGDEVERDGYRIAPVAVVAPRPGLRLRALRDERRGEFDPGAAQRLGLVPGPGVRAGPAGRDRPRGHPRAGAWARRGPAASWCCRATRARASRSRIAAHRADVLVHEATFARGGARAGGRQRPLDRPRRRRRSRARPT